MSATSPNVPAKEVPARELIGKVRQALAESAEASIRDLKVDAADNKVRLIGMVATLHEKQRAGQIAAGLLGVARVENSLTVAVDRPLLDPEIRRMVEEALGDYPASDPANIGVREVEDGVVYLSGKVPTIDELRGAVDIASRIKGVVKVVNEMEIAVGVPIDDITLSNSVMDALSDDPRIHPFDVHIQTEDGEVIISGEVEDGEARVAATELARGVPGVRKVTNVLVARS